MNARLVRPAAGPLPRCGYHVDFVFASETLDKIVDDGFDPPGVGLIVVAGDPDAQFEKVAGRNREGSCEPSGEKVYARSGRDSRGRIWLLLGWRRRNELVDLIARILVAQGEEPG